MRAVVAVSQNDRDPLVGLELQEVPMPEPRAGWTRVRLRAASLNPHDVWTLRGVGHPAERIPIVLGCDGAGVTDDGREVILYSVLGVPLALLADKVGKTQVIAGSLVVWSGFTALCGTATGFWSLFLYRLGVGVGEAGGVAPSYALIADYFIPDDIWEALSAHFDDQQCMDAIFVVGHFVMLGMFLNTAGVPIDPDVPLDPELDLRA